MQGDLKIMRTCIRQNVCTSLRIGVIHQFDGFDITCIRQNVCTSLRTHTATRNTLRTEPCIRQNVCTSLRMLESFRKFLSARLAYVKTYALH